MLLPVVELVIHPLCLWIVSVFGLENALYVVFIARGAWTGLRSGRSTVRIPVETRDFFSYPKSTDPFWTPQPALY